MSSEISLHRRPTVPGEAPAPASDANPVQQGTTVLEVTGPDAEREDETPAPEVASPQRRAFASDMSQMIDVGVCL